MTTQTINYNGNAVQVDMLNSNSFCVHLPGKKLRLQYQPDNEGADHWMDMDSNHETEETKKLGEVIGPLMEKRV